MSGEGNKSSSQRFCVLCGEATDTFVRQHETRFQLPEYKFFERKIPLCESCFKEIQPTKANKQRVEFWRPIFPVIEEGGF